MTKDEVKALIKQNVYKNGQEKITGDKLQETLLAMLDASGSEDSIPHIVFKSKNDFYVRSNSLVGSVDVPDENYILLGTACLSDDSVAEIRWTVKLFNNTWNGAGLWLTPNTEQETIEYSQAVRAKEVNVYFKYSESDYKDVFINKNWCSGIIEAFTPGDEEAVDLTAPIYLNINVYDE